MNAKQIKMLILGLTGRCNFSCAYCYAYNHPPIDMSFKTAAQAIDMAAAGGQKFVLQLSGGEPLLNFELVQDIVKYIRQHRISAVLQLQTNASLVTPPIAAFLKKNGVGVGISLDGRPKANDLLRRLPSGGETAHLIIRGAQTLAAAGVETGITCVVTASNVKELPGIVEMAYYLGNVRKIGFDLLRGQGRGMSVCAASTDDLKDALCKVLAEAKKFKNLLGKKLIFSHAERVENLAGRNLDGFAHCHAMNGEAAYVDAEGEIYACASLAGREEFRLGHVSTGIDKERQKAVCSVIENCMSFCRACSSFSLCGGGCFARWYGFAAAGEPYRQECVLKEVFIRAYREGKEKN